MEGLMTVFAVDDFSGVGTPSTVALGYSEMPPFLLMAMLKDGDKGAITYVNAGGSGKRDDMGVVTESGSAGALLPVGPSKAESARITARMSPHGFRGKDLAACSVCGQPVTDPVHSMSPKRSAVDEISTLLGREIGTRAKDLPKDAKRAIHAATFQADATSIEGPIHDAVVTVFADQAKATLSRLLGKRGKQMMRAADGTDDETPPVNPAQIFDLAFWINRLEQALQPSLSSVAPIARNRVQTQIGTSAMGVDDASSLGALRTVLNDRVKRLSDEVNQTTYDALGKALHEGITNGEGIPDLAKRVQGVFDDASNARATMIARTESVGALNQASHVYASNLPKGIVGGSEWLAHSDLRTRPDHRLANGEKRAIGKPFDVGGFPMMFPGDPTAPPSEVCGCRCCLAYIPDMKTADQALGVAA